VLATTMLLATQAFAAQTPRDSSVGEQHTTTTRSPQQRSQANDRMQVQPGKAAPPNTALLEYLGEFDDAADGLDAMGLADTEATAKEAVAGDKERQ
jgi:hypothetical protein